jgi:hypothetical protein
LDRYTSGDGDYPRTYSLNIVLVRRSDGAVLSFECDGEEDAEEWLDPDDSPPAPDSSNVRGVWFTGSPLLFRPPWNYDGKCPSCLDVQGAMQGADHDDAPWEKLRMDFCWHPREHFTIIGDGDGDGDCLDFECDDGLEEALAMLPWRNRETRGTVGVEEAEDATRGVEVQRERLKRATAAAEKAAKAVEEVRVALATAEERRRAVLGV